MRNQVVTPEDGVAWVTGAGLGLGYHTALELARAGWTVIATARHEEDLRLLCAAAEGMTGDIYAYPGDITDPNRMLVIATQAEVACAPIALAVFADAQYEPADATLLDAATFARAWESNVLGTLHGLAAVVPRMIERGKGHVAVVSALAGQNGFSAGAAYGASMAALAALAENLKIDLDRHGVRISLVTPAALPGAARMSLPNPLALPEREAARRLVAGLKRQAFETSFPKRLSLPLRLLRALPRDLYIALAKRLLPNQARTMAAPVHSREQAAPEPATQEGRNA